MRCPSCGKLLPVLDCVNCKDVVLVKCAGCGTVVQVQNEAKISRRQQKRLGKTWREIIGKTEGKNENKR